MDRIEAVGAVLTEHRRSLGLTQAQLAERVGLHRNEIGRAERGQTRVALNTLFILADGLGVPASELLQSAEKLATRRSL